MVIFHSFFTCPQHPLSTFHRCYSSEVDGKAPFNVILEGFLLQVITTSVMRMSALKPKFARFGTVWNFNFLRIHNLPKSFFWFQLDKV